LGYKGVRRACSPLTVLASLLFLALVLGLRLLRPRSFDAAEA
jgi:hypothetical protein